MAGKVVDCSPQPLLADGRRLDLGMESKAEQRSQRRPGKKGLVSVSGI